MSIAQSYSAYSGICCAIHIGVGFCVARFIVQGNAKAFKRGTCNRYRFPRFFFYNFSLRGVWGTMSNMKRLLFIWLCILITSNIYAQFSNTNNSFYHYKFEYTYDNGIKSSSTLFSKSYICVLKEDMMGFTDAANSTLVESNLEYYNKRALENNNNDYKKWKTNTRPRGRNSFTISRIYKLDTSLSTSTYHTYRCLEKKSLSKPFRGQAIVENYWGEPQWRESCLILFPEKLAPSYSLFVFRK